MVITAQWELVRGNGFGYTVLSAFGLFYGGFGAIITPFFGVKEAYGDDTAGYNNALGFWVLSKSSAVFCARGQDSLIGRIYTVWAVWNVFFLIGSFAM